MLFPLISQSDNAMKKQMHCNKNNKVFCYLTIFKTIFCTFFSGQLTDWSAWSACPASCQAVVNVYLKQYRSRQCVNTSLTGNCNGQSLNDEAICAKDVPCPGKKNGFLISSLINAKHPHLKKDLFLRLLSKKKKNVSAS